MVYHSKMLCQALTFNFNEMCGGTTTVLFCICSTCFV